jgi:hypothetical protein
VKGWQDEFKFCQCQSGGLFFGAVPGGGKLSKPVSQQFSICNWIKAGV